MSNNKIKQAEYELFCEWSARPRMYRNPDTQEAWCLEHNVSTATVAIWKREPQFKADVRRFMDQWAFTLVPEVIASLHGKAMIGDTKAMEVFLDHFDEHQQKRKGEPDSPEEKNASNMRDALLEAYKRRQLNKKANGEKTTTSTTTGPGGNELPG